MIKFLLSKWYNVPYEFKSVWYNITEHYPKIEFPAVRKDGVYIPPKMGNIVAMRNVYNGKIAYYRIVKTHRMSGDWKYEYDRYRCDMKFVYVK